MPIARKSPTKNPLTAPTLNPFQYSDIVLLRAVGASCDVLVNPVRQRNQPVPLTCEYLNQRDAWLLIWKGPSENRGDQPRKHYEATHTRRDHEPSRFIPVRDPVAWTFAVVLLAP